VVREPRASQGAVHVTWRQPESARPAKVAPGESALIAKLKDLGPVQAPTANLSELHESDVEQKLVYPFLIVHPSFLGLPPDWVRTKDYMEPTDIDKGAGKRVGYIPDYSVWISGFPLLIIESKRPDEPVEAALREAHLYAGRILVSQQLTGIDAQSPRDARDVVDRHVALCRSTSSR
jgi:hypothetical protein